jgi:hypothetical protein
MSNILSYASFAIAVAAMVVASQSAVGEKQKPIAGTYAFAKNSSEPAITPAWVYYPSQFVNKAKFVEREYPQF